MRTKPFIHQLFLRWALAGLVGVLCQCSRSDIGELCPQLLDGAAAITDSGEPTVVLSQNVVAMGPQFEPCESLICVAAQGRSGYCSTSCVDDKGCPQGFVCQSVQTLGEFASEKFCVWKTCETRADCGGGKDYCCNQIAGTGDNPLFKQCAFSTDGKCL